MLKPHFFRHTSVRMYPEGLRPNVPAALATTNLTTKNGNRHACHCFRRFSSEIYNALGGVEPKWLYADRSLIDTSIDGQSTMQSRGYGQDATPAPTLRSRRIQQPRATMPYECKGSRHVELSSRRGRHSSGQG